MVRVPGDQLPFGNEVAVVGHVLFRLAKQSVDSRMNPVTSARARTGKAGMQTQTRSTLTYSVFLGGSYEVQKHHDLFREGTELRPPRN